jgi:hypothetical protein
LVCDIECLTDGQKLLKHLIYSAELAESSGTDQEAEIFNNFKSYYSKINSRVIYKRTAINTDL